MNRNRIIGLVLMSLPAFWLYRYLRFIYFRTHPDIIWFSNYPNWLLVLNTIIGLFGIRIGLKVFNNQIKIKKGILLAMALLVFGIFLELVFNLYTLNAMKMQ